MGIQAHIQGRGFWGDHTSPRDSYSHIDPEVAARREAKAKHRKETAARTRVKKKVKP
jgi:hypothetical protein